MKKKVRATRLSVYSNTFLILFKVVVGVITGSVSIISEAIHSALDLVASIIAFFTVRMSDEKPDKEHPYGHGKFENISGVIEALLIFIAAGWIFYEAIEKILHREHIQFIGWGSVVMIISAIVNILVSRRLSKVAKETGSIALEADALNHKTDVYTSAGIALGLFIILISRYQLYILDPIIAILISLFIIYQSFYVMKKAILPLLDTALSPEELTEIESLLKEMKVNYHDLKSRKSGNHKFVDLHLNLDPSLTLDKVHGYCDEIEIKLTNEIKNITINIHAEPLSDKN